MTDIIYKQAWGCVHTHTCSVFPSQISEVHSSRKKYMFFLFSLHFSWLDSASVAHIMFYSCHEPGDVIYWLVFLQLFVLRCDWLHVDLFFFRCLCYAVTGFSHPSIFQGTPYPSLRNTWRMMTRWVVYTWKVVKKKKYAAMAALAVMFLRLLTLSCKKQDENLSEKVLLIFYIFQF